MTRSGDILLSVKDISLRFGGVRALTDVSFDIHEGEIFAIIGPNGAGKSSMLNCINGFYHPQDGTITFKGEERRQMRPHEAAAQGISRTFQNIALFKGMTTLGERHDRAHAEDAGLSRGTGVLYRPRPGRRKSPIARRSRK